MVFTLVSLCLGVNGYHDFLLTPQGSGSLGEAEEWARDKHLVKAVRQSLADYEVNRQQAQQIR